MKRCWTLHRYAGLHSSTFSIEFALLTIYVRGIYRIVAVSLIQKYTISDAAETNFTVLADSVLKEIVSRQLALDAMESRS